MVLIEELEISNCLSIKKVFLRFENEHFVTIFNCSNSYKQKRSLIWAIKFLLCENETGLTLEGFAGVPPDPCYVRLKFKIPKDGSNICVDAMRIAQHPNLIYYYYNGKQYIDPKRVYHERCQIDVTTIYPLLNGVFSNENNNLMHIWHLNRCPFSGDIEKSYELFDDYLDIFNSRSQSEQTCVLKLTQTIVLIDKEFELSQKRTFMAIANEIGKIFEYITFGKYVVKFYIALCGDNMNLQDLKWENIDLKSVETYIENTNRKDSILWNKLEPGLKYLLKIAQLIALAKYLGQTFILMEDTTQLQDFQNQQMIREAILQKDCINTESNWENTNFLKRIANVCNEMKIMIFLNYHGALPLPPECSNVIKCHDSREVDGQSIYVSQFLNSMTLDDFVCLFDKTVE